MNTKSLLQQCKALGKKIRLDILVNTLQKKAPLAWFYLKKLLLPDYGGRREIKLDGKPFIYDVFYCRDKRAIGIVGRYDRIREPRQLRCVFGSGAVVTGVFVDDYEHEIEGAQVLLVLFPVPNDDLGDASISVTLKLGERKLISNFLVPSGESGGKDLLSVSTLMKDEDPFLLEWIAYYRILGANHFYIYDNRSLNRKKIRELLRPLMNEGVVTLIDWDYPYESGAADNSWRFCQRGQMHHCLYKYGHQTEWLLFIDVDEFIFPVAGEDSLLPLLRQHGDNADVAGLQFKMIWFGNSGFESVPDGLVIENYTHRAPQVLEAGREKYMVKPSVAELLFIHGLKASSADTKLIAVPPDQYRINHYYATSSKRQRRGYTDHNDVEDLGMKKFAGLVRKSLASS